MALKIPLFPIAASPLLSAALAKIARTPAARLSIIYRLTGRQLECVPGVRPTECGLLSPRERLARDAQFCGRSLTAEAHPPALPLRRTLGQSLLVDRLVAGGIIGTTLNILGRETEYVVCDQPTIGKNFDAAV